MPLDERLSMRTAKSCGPDVPVLASSLAMVLTYHARRWGQESRSPGRARINRKPIARGMPVVSAEPVVPAACIFFCRRAMGAASIRHSLHPLVFEGRGNHDSGADPAARAMMHVGSATEANN